MLFIDLCWQRKQARSSVRWCLFSGKMWFQSGCRKRVCGADVMDFENYMKKNTTDINRELKLFFPKKISRSWLIKNLSREDFGFDIETYQKSVSGPVWNFLGRGGKRWRPTLLLLCCEAVGGSRKRAMPFTVIPELGHNGTIIIDDLED